MSKPLPWALTVTTQAPVKCAYLASIIDWLSLLGWLVVCGVLGWRLGLWERRLVSPGAKVWKLAAIVVSAVTWLVLVKMIAILPSLLIVRVAADTSQASAVFGWVILGSDHWLVIGSGAACIVIAYIAARLHRRRSETRPRVALPGQQSCTVASSG